MIELTIAIISILLVIGISLWVKIKLPKKITNYEFFTAIGRLSPNLIFFSLFATTFSAFTVVGLPALYYAHGVGAFFFLGLGVMLTPIILMTYGVKISKLRQDQEKNNKTFLSPIGLLLDGYNSKSLSKILSLTTILFLFPYLILQLAGIGKLFVSYTDGAISYITGLIILAALVGFYLWKGGSIVDAKTDQIQGIFTLVGVGVFGAVLLFFMKGTNFLAKISEAGLTSIPGPNGYFTVPLLISYAILFAFIVLATPQVSVRIMAANKKTLKMISLWYPIAGVFTILFAGLIGLYAAANVAVSTPDFVVGDVIQSVLSNSTGFLLGLIIIASILVIVGVVAASISTIDSVLLSVTAIFEENVLKREKIKVSLSRILMISVLVISVILSISPPKFIVSLATIQIAGLMGLLPCLLAPLHGIKSKTVGWFALSFGLISVILNLFLKIPLFGFEPAIMNLLAGIVGIFVGLIFEKIMRN
ncbi:hypothetical protein K9M18_04550 [Candidatus Woesearchaeota archaeon]|nr:hypothetical protein [Candidatus Woesearchaeota archaeon]MCF8012844.1 hypothetical protein [Candidatus Woesearchaeota archaeon]